AIFIAIRSPHGLADRLRQRRQRAQSRAHQPRGAGEEKTLLEKISSIITTLHVLVLRSRIVRWERLEAITHRWKLASGKICMSFAVSYKSFALSPQPAISGTGMR